MNFFTIKKLKTLCAALLLISYAATAQQSYCTPTWSGWSVNEPTEPITLVQLGQNGVNGINNATSDVVSSAIPRYEDFSSTAMTVVKGETYTLVVKGTTNGDKTNYVTVYFDWNGDGTFSNATPANEAAQQVLTNQPEKHQHLPALINSTGLDALSVTHPVLIPTDAFTGTIRMRVVKNFNAPSNTPCANPFIFGQVEDYTLTIVNELPPTGCANTEPGNNAGDTGCVSFTYNGQTVSYTTVRGADGNIWLQQNLGADGVATAMDQEAAYGDLFQWGRWDDGHQKRTSAITATVANPNNPAGLGTGQNTFITATPAWWSGNALTDTWTAATPAQATDVNGCDPCKALGEGWVMPTQANWEALVTAENITNPASAFASNLKFPANGYRSNTTGGFTYNGQRGYYWSSTTSSTGAKYLYVGTTIANTAAGGPRGQGAAVRCIKMAQQQVQAVAVTTQNSIPATITTAGGTLQLVATITPTAASQNVTWSIASGSEFATVSATGLVTATANGTVTVRATSVADITKFGELAVVINTTPVCPSLTELYENFDTLSCCALGVVPECWESIMIGGSNQIISSTQPASGTSQIYMNGYGAGKTAIVVLPHFSNVNAGTHQFRFKVKTNSAGGLLQFGYITDAANADTFTLLEDISINNTSYSSADSERVFIVPATVPANARLAIRNNGSTWAGMYWDDVYWEPIAITGVTVTTQNNVPATITTQNGTRQLVATVNPSATSQNVTWTITSGSAYATVDANGLVTATANGTVTVRATSVADTTKFDDIEITISYAVPVQGVVVSTQNNVPAAIATAGGTLQLVATISPANATNQNVTWSIASGSEFATVNANGLVTATSNGAVTVRATSASNTMLYDEIEITISYVVAVESLEVTTQNNVPAEITVIDGTLQLVAAITPADANNQGVVWTIVSGAEYATIDANGLVTATNNGTVVVRAASAEDATVFDEITITLTNQLTCQELYPGATEPIALVNFAGINNESSATIGGAFTESFMSVTGTAERDEEYILTVKGNTNGDFAHTVTAYIDWNQDMDFSDEGEVYTVGTLQNTTGTDTTQVTLAITVPETATLGNTTLRISKRLSEGEIACNTNLYGQTEYYTLTITETNGLESHNGNTVSIYPNPFTDVLNIEATQEVVFTEVYNTLGQAVLTAKGTTVNVTGLSNGVYMVKVSLENGAVQTTKIVKQ